MQFLQEVAGQEERIVALVTRTFTASEGEGEGDLVGALARTLLADTAQEDRHVFFAEDEGRVLAAAIFSRLSYPQDARTVFLLAPMAVATDRQGKGLGQALLRHALSALRAAGVDVAITYGDPAFYGKVGFRPMTTDFARPPLPLSQPIGWIGQSLTDATLTPLQGPSTCVAALNDPALW